MPSAAADLSRGVGPAVPGVQGAGSSVSGQDDIDALLNNFASGG
jgi:hypothetical protein